MTIRYAVSYDRPNTKGAIHLGDFRDPMDTASLVKQCQNEGKLNVRLRFREISDYIDWPTEVTVG